MKWDQVKRDWLSVSQQVRLKWGKFTMEDLSMISGQRESFVRLFEQRYGDDHATAEVKVDAFVQGLRSQPKPTIILSWSQRIWERTRNYFHGQSRN